MRPADLKALVQACLQDLEAIPGFLRANDAGAQQPGTRDQEVRRQAAFDAARRQAETAVDDSQCAAILQAYLGAWRKSHLFVRPVNVEGSSGIPQTSAEPLLPSLDLLSPFTVLITVPSFSPAVRVPLAALIEQHRQELQARPNWVIDVRGNGGGNDTSYACLLPWLMADGWLEVSEQVYVTPANLQAEERVCETFAPDDVEAARIIEAAVRRMRSAGSGTWVQHEDDAGWRYVRPPDAEGQRPQRVAVLMDSRCGSSCEQFLLTVRQSFIVKLVGHSRSGGALDASNVRPHLLPSGRRRLFYATTLSNRLPGLPIDGIGICPDVFLPDPENASDRFLDVQRTQRWLEHCGWGLR